MVCQSCHKKDDKHDGQLSERCDQCHNDKTWKGATFDHSQSRFPLTGRHVPVTCKSCHTTLRYKDAARDCWSCHKAEDKHKEKFGVQCEACHTARGWRVWSFDHTAKTKFKLDGAHAKVVCESCHTQKAPAGKLAAPISSTCVSCHRLDDVHEGGFGVRCEQCHTVDNWKTIKNRVSASKQPARTGGSPWPT
jgi:hypothetical protein